MAKLIYNTELDTYTFDDGINAPVECIKWIETGKTTKAYPDGIPQIKLPKNNVTNRLFVSEGRFKADAIDNVLEIEVKTSAPRQLGAGTVNPIITKYLDEADIAEFNSLVTNAQSIYAESKSKKAKKPEEMTKEELETLLAVLEGKIDMPATTSPKSFMDCFTEEEYERYIALMAKAQEAKANRPKVKKGPLTDEEKAKRAAKRKATQISKARALLDELLAQEVTTSIELDDDEFEVDSDIEL